MVSDFPQAYYSNDGMHESAQRDARHRNPATVWPHRKINLTPFLILSMSRPGMPYDNAMAESFFSTLKLEGMPDKAFVTCPLS